MRGYVGKKGEIYIEKRARELAKLKPGDDLIILIRDDEIVIRRIPKLEDILRKKALAIINAKEIEEASEEGQMNYWG